MKTFVSYRRVKKSGGQVQNQNPWHTDNLT